MDNKKMFTDYLYHIFKNKKTAYLIAAAALFIFGYILGNLFNLKDITASDTANAIPEVRIYDGDIQLLRNGEWIVAGNANVFMLSDPFFSANMQPICGALPDYDYNNVRGNGAVQPTYSGSNYGSYSTSGSSPAVNTPASTPAATSPATPTTPPSSNDGEDLEWSGDIL